MKIPVTEPPLIEQLLSGFDSFDEKFVIKGLYESQLISFAFNFSRVMTCLRYIGVNFKLGNTNGFVIGRISLLIERFVMSVAVLFYTLLQL